MDKLLIVDDDAEFSGLLAECFRDSFEVAFAPSAGKGLLEIDDVSAVLLDVKLPDMRAPEFLYWMKRFGSKAPVVVMTAGTFRTELIVECRDFENVRACVEKTASLFGIVESVALAAGASRRRHGAAAGLGGAA